MTTKTKAQRKRACAVTKAWVAKHLDRRKAYEKAYYKKNRDRITKRINKLRDARTAQGLCDRCGQPLEEERKGRVRLCAKCSEESVSLRRRTKEKRIAAGLCPKCHERKITPGRKTCAPCRQKNTREAYARFRKYDQQGLCIRCVKNPQAEGLKNGALGCRLCEICWMKRRAKEYLGDAVRWPLLLKKLEQQKRRCALSGIPLVIGVNASIDHKLCQAKHPYDRLNRNNLHWVDIRVNKMKGALLLAEFLTLVKAIHKTQFHKIQ